MADTTKPTKRQGELDLEEFRRHMAVVDDKLASGDLEGLSLVYQYREGEKTCVGSTSGMVDITSVKALSLIGMLQLVCQRIGFTI